jgi:hypothetical protein
MANLVVRYGSLRQIWLYAKPTVADLIMRHGPLHRMKPCSKKSVLISALWAIAQDLVIRYGPEAQGFCYELVK